MAKNIEEIPLVRFNLNDQLDIPLYKQLYELLRKAITDGKLKAGQRLPGTRSLAAELSVSRNTIATAFNQLLIEGYIKGMIGSGTYVNEIPDKLPETHIAGSKKYSYRKIESQKSKSVITLIKNYGDVEVIPFQTGIPAINDFPIKTWLRLLHQVSQTLSAMQLGYGDAAGYYPLREAIASYLKTYRAVECSADQLVIVNGSQQGLDLIARILLNQDRIVWLEDPGYFGAKASMLFADARIIPSPLDNEGIDIKYCDRKNPKPHLIYTTPSHQFPLGVTMSIARRIELLQYAGRNKCWIIEDDYDGEFRYSGNPLPSLQGMDTYGRVLYLGTFSKVLFPGLRIGYLVLPNAELMKSFASAKYIIDRQCPIYEQIVLTKFIEEGHFTRHIRKMRMLYKSRQEFLVETVNNEFNGTVIVNPSPAGMHLIIWLPEGSDDKNISQKAAEQGVIASPLSEYSIKYKQKPGLILGYTTFTNVEVKKAVLALKKAIEYFL